MITTSTFVSGLQPDLTRWLGDQAIEGNTTTEQVDRDSFQRSRVGRVGAHVVATGTRLARGVLGRHADPVVRHDVDSLARTFPGLLDDATPFWNRVPVRRRLAQAIGSPEAMVDKTRLFAREIDLTLRHPELFERFLDGAVKLGFISVNERPTARQFVVFQWVLNTTKLIPDLLRQINAHPNGFRGPLDSHSQLLFKTLFSPHAVLDVVGITATPQAIYDHVAHTEHAYVDADGRYDFEWVKFDFELLMLLGYLHHGSPHHYLDGLEWYLEDVISGAKPELYFILERTRGELGRYHRELLSYVRDYREKHRHALDTADFSQVRDRKGLNSLGSALSLARQTVPAETTPLVAYLFKTWGSPRWILPYLQIFPGSSTVRP